MFLRCMFTLALCVVCAYCAAQIPYDTELDTAEMREMREKKIRVKYELEHPFDSITGNLKKNAPADTTYTVYDRMGRETCFSYLNTDGTRAFSRLYYNAKGQVVRGFSYDGDSTNGFVDYWKYNDSGRVVQEITCTRDGRLEDPFSGEQFFYSATGQLYKQKSFWVSNEGKDYREQSHFYYWNRAEIQVEFDEDGDTAYIDTSSALLDNDPYWSRRFRYDDDYGPSRKKLVSEAKTQVDTLGRRIRRIYSRTSYDYETGAVDDSYIDTAYYDLQGNILEFRDDRHIRQYFYKDNGELDYAICYNRQMQPLYKRTESFEYYR